MDGVYRVETVCIYNKSWHHLPTPWSSCHPNYPEVATNFSEYEYMQDHDKCQAKDVFNINIAAIFIEYKGW
jgi:hypothetical protein